MLGIMYLPELMVAGHDGQENHDCVSIYRDLESYFSWSGAGLRFRQGEFE